MTHSSDFVQVFVRGIFAIHITCGPTHGSECKLVQARELRHSTKIRISWTGV